MVLAGRTLCLHPSSRIARENIEVFCDTWAQAVNEMSKLAKESDAAAHGRVAAEKQAYMSLPRPGVSYSSSSEASPATANTASQACSSSPSYYVVDIGELPLDDVRILQQQQDDDSSEGSADPDERRNFEYRMSLILDDLHAQPPSDFELSHSSN